MKALKVLAGATALVLVSGCMPMEGAANRADGHRADVPLATATGPALNCIPIAQITESRVRDDWTIDFRTAGNRWYRNTLPNRCSGLGFERAFSYATSQSQLCNVDIITVIQSSGGERRGSCGLGTFQPVTLAE